MVYIPLVGVIHISQYCGKIKLNCHQISRKSLLGSNKVKVKSHKKLAESQHKLD